MMKISRSVKGKRSLLLAGIGLALTMAGVGLASAQVYKHGNSTTIIEQRSGSGLTETQITRYRDGQKIITRDGNSVDITIQREGRFAGPGPGPAEYLSAGADCFELATPGRRAGADCIGGGPSCVQDAFKRRMLDRMGW